MFRRSFPVANNLTKVLLLATAVTLSACSSFDPGSQMVSDASNQTVASESSAPHLSGHYYYPG